MCMAFVFACNRLIYYGISLNVGNLRARDLYEQFLERIGGDSISHRRANRSRYCGRADDFDVLNGSEVGLVPSLAVSRKESRGYSLLLSVDSALAVPSTSVYLYTTGLFDHRSIGGVGVVFDDWTHRVNQCTASVVFTRDFSRTSFDCLGAFALLSR